MIKKIVEKAYKIIGIISARIKNHDLMIFLYIIRKVNSGNWGEKNRLRKIFCIGGLNYHRWILSNWILDRK